MTKPFRLSQGGSRIDRSKALTFSFDGRDVQGFAGDTVASAVLGSGQKLFGRSFKYHRPRGVVGLGSEEMNALIGVGVVIRVLSDQRFRRNRRLRTGTLARPGER